MALVIYDTAVEYEAEFRAVRAALLVRGITLQAWAEREGVSRQLVSGALKGKTLGPKARDVRRRLLAEVV